MGFKVTVHRNGAKHGEAHYSSEAVAVGMAKKMRNAGADVSVARCNGACCCDTKANPRRRNGKKAWKPTPKPVNAAAVAAARALGQTAYARGVGSAPAQDPMLKPLIASVPGDTATVIAMLDAWTKEWHKAQRVATDAEVAALGIFPKQNRRRRNGTTAANIAAARFLAHGLMWNRR